MSNNRPRSLRRALALRIVLGGGFLLALLFEALDLLIDHELYTRFDAALTARGRLLATELTGGLPPGRRVVTAWPEFRAGGHTDYFQIWDAAGRSLARSPSSGERDLARPPQPPAGQPVLYDLELPDGHRGRAAALRLGDDGRVFAIATEREALDALERHIHAALLVTIGGLLVLLVGLSFMAVRSALRPLAEFGADAEHRSQEPSADPYDLRALPLELQPIAAALDRAYTRLAQMLLRERRFARDLAHELRTPLAELFAIVETLPRPSAAQEADCRTQVERTLTGMTRIVDGLLALARYEAGIDAPVIEPFELVKVVRAQGAALAHHARQRRLQLELALPEELWIVGDELLIERIVANLLGNAVIHAPEGDRVVIRCVLVDGAARLTVDNAAPALSAADVARLGERHFRASQASASSGHAGLGLALCAALAERLALTLSYSLADGRLAVELSGLRPLDAAL